MSHLNPGLLSAYNSLTDKHLTGYFSNTRIRRHLQRAGLITRSGRIVPDREYRHKLIQGAHHRHVRECLAQAIFHKVLEMERLHQTEIKRKMEEFARRERVHKIKVERSKRYEEEIIHILSPHPPKGTRGIQKEHSGPEGEHSESSESLGSSRPNTAPGKMQRPVRLKPINSNSATASLRRSSPYRVIEPSNENNQPFNCTMDKESWRHLTTAEASRGISPYCLPVINNFVTPVPPVTKKKEGGLKVTRSSTLRGRRLRPTTVSSGADVSEDHPLLRSSVHQSRVCVKMVYFGKTVHLAHDLIDMRDEVKVFQQHCGGQNLCVYKGRLLEGDTFQFISRRHRGFPFSLTFFLNGLQVERLSSCCEFKHRKGSRLGGRNGHFGLSGVEGASPCYKCIITMGLDKKPIPPPRRAKEDREREESVTSPHESPEMERETTGDDELSSSDYEMSQQQDTAAQVNEERAAEEHKVRDDYEADFEEDDEGPAKDAQVKEKKSPSPSSESERQVQEREASETEDDKKGEDIKSRSGFSSSGSNREESDTEATQDLREDETTKQPEEVDPEEDVTPTDKPNSEEAAESAVAKDSDTPGSAGDSTEIHISDTSVPSGNENKHSGDTSGDTEAEKMVDDSKQEDEQERAKSVQEKLAEAMFKESQYSSEPELSDTSTEEEEESTDKGHEQNNNDIVAKRPGTSTEQQQTFIKETKPEESVGECKVVWDQEEVSELKEKEDGSENGPNEKSDSTEHETIVDEHSGKAASEEAAAENDKAEDTSRALHPVCEDNMTKENKTSEPEEHVAAKSTDASTTAEAEENDKTAEEADTEMEQGAKSSTKDESSVSEPNKNTDETAVADNADVEAAMTESETVKMKAEPSEEQEALSCEEAPVSDTEEKQQGDSDDSAAASETEVTAEKSSSSLDGTGDTVVEKTDTSVDNARDESSTDDTKEEEAEEVSVVEESKNNGEKEMHDVGEEQTEKCVEIDDDAEKEKIMKESNDEGKQTNPDEIPEAETSEEREKDGTATKEEQAGEKVENEEIREGTKNYSDTEEGNANGEPTGKTLDKKDEDANEERVDQLEKPEKDEDINEGQSGAEGTKTDQMNEGEETDETKTAAAAAEEQSDEAAMAENDENGDQAEQSESVENKYDVEEKVLTDKTGEEEEISEIPEEHEKTADDGKISTENTVEPKDAGDSEEADGTKITENTLNNTPESEDVEKETERAKKSENGDVDVENGEISSRAGNNTHENEAEAADESDLKTESHIEDEQKTEEPAKDEGPAGVESVDNAEKQEDDKVDQALDTDMVESEAKEEGKQDKSAQIQQEAAGTELKEESKSEGEDSEETKQDGKSELDDENRDSDSTKNNENIQNNEDTVVGDLSAASRENGADTEEVTKTLKEEASVQHKPQAQNHEADETEDGVAAAEASPEALAREDSTDLVTNWVTMHQASKLFEKFVEPPEDLREENLDAQVFSSTEEVMLSSESPQIISNEEKEQMLKDENASGEETKVETLESDEGTSQEKEVKDLTTEAEENDKESTNGHETTSEEHKGSRGPLEEDSAPDGPAETQNDISKTEVESIAGTHHSAASGKPESVTENLPEEETHDSGPDMDEEQTEEHPEHLVSPDELKETEEMQAKTDQQSREATEITDFTMSRSEDGSQEGSHTGGIQSKPPEGDGSIDLQLIKHTLTETLFGHTKVQ